MIDKLVKKDKAIPLSVRYKKNPFLSMQTAVIEVINDFYNFFQSPSITTEDWENMSITPALDMVDEEKKFKIVVEVPGMGPEDLEVSIIDEKLVVRGNKTTSKQDKDKNYLSREIAYGFYQRTIHLPDFVDIQKAKATFKKGMLWVEFQKKAGAPKLHKEIKVETA